MANKVLGVLGGTRTTGNSVFLRYGGKIHRGFPRSGTYSDDNFK